MTFGRTVVASLSLTLLVGCGAIMHGGRQTIDIQSTPSGAKIETNPISMVYTTPSTLNLERKNSYLLTFTSPGYNPATIAINNSIGVGTIIMDVVFGGIIGVVIDAVTGDWFGLSPESVIVSLTKTVGAVGPDTLDIKLGKTADASVEISSDAPNIQVQVTRK
jgi:hypothetical protein